MKTIVIKLTEEESKKLDNVIKNEYQNIKVSKTQYIKKLINEKINISW